MFSYLIADNAERYVRIMGLFVAHKRRFGLRLTPRELLERWDEVDPAGRPSTDELIAALDQLYTWDAVDRQADTGKAASTAEFKRARNTYDITAAGEASWEAAQQIFSLERQVASLGQQRLVRIAETVEALADLAAGAPLDGRRAEQLLITLRAEIAETVQGISSFMRELGEVMTLGERLQREPFLAYKARVMEHLEYFAPVQRECQSRFAQAVDVIDTHVDQLAEAVVAAGTQVAGYQEEAGQADALRATEVREQWRQARDWLAGAGETTPWDQLRRTIDGAVDWLLDTVHRLASEQSGRLDRSADYRRLAELLIADPDTGPDLFHLAFGMTSARHLSVTDPDDDQIAGGANQSWWDVAGLLMDRTLRIPSARKNQGRTPHIRDTTQARILAREAAEAEARQARALRAHLLTLHGRLLSNIGQVDGDALAALDEWLMECGAHASGPADPGPWHYADAVRGLTVAITPQAGTARVRTPDGVWELDDLLLEIDET